MRVNIFLQSRVSEYSLATLSAGVGDSWPTARDAADASRSSLKHSPAPGAARRETEVSSSPRLTEIVPVTLYAFSRMCPKIGQNASAQSIRVRPADSCFRLVAPANPAEAKHGHIDMESRF